MYHTVHVIQSCSHVIYFMMGRAAAPKVCPYAYGKPYVRLGLSTYLFIIEFMSSLLPPHTTEAAEEPENRRAVSAAFAMPSFPSLPGTVPLYTNFLLDYSTFYLLFT